MMWHMVTVHDILIKKAGQNMGIYFNPDNDKFYESVNSEIYIDKSGLIKYLNSVIHTSQKYVCVSRPRRFGKSMAANMIAAYYSRGCDSTEIFKKLKISLDNSFEKFINSYNVIQINMQEFLSRSKDVESMIDLLQKKILWELLNEYSDVDYFDKTDLIESIQNIYQTTRIPFVIIIDEWDCIFREYKTEQKSQERYLDFLRDLLKDKAYVHLAYMTGILPIKKYGTHSALNMFSEFSMTNPGQLAEYVGFIQPEVDAICEKYDMDIQEMKKWYDGYYFKNVGEIYNPKSVVEAALTGIYDNYWNRTETYEALKFYIDMNFEGLKDDILCMMAGEEIIVNVGSFVNDMTTFSRKDDVITLLIHLGYLGYHFDTKRAFIPNNEIMSEYAYSIVMSDWGEVSNALSMSQMTLEAIWNKDEKKVAEAISKSHVETAHLQYNDENALSYTISIALYVARNYYTVIRELPTGNGFADIVYIPRKQYPDKPALVVELKWNKSAGGAIIQIKEKNYIAGLEAYADNMLLVGINYDKVTREHSCIIQQA